MYLIKFTSTFSVYNLVEVSGRDKLIRVKNIEKIGTKRALWTKSEHGLNMREGKKFALYVLY